MSQSYRKYEITTTFKQEICRNLTFLLRLRQIFKFRFYCLTITIPSISDHVESELLIDSVIAKGIRLRDDAPVGGNRSKAEIVRTFSMSLNDVNKFSKTRTTRKLSEDKHIKMIPMSKTPVISSIIMPTDNTIELTFKPISDLIEYELPRIHNCSNLNLDAKVSISNVGQVFLELLHCA